jgi:hypothetical protein
MRRREFIAGDPIGGKCTPVPPTLAPLHDWWPRSSARLVGRTVCLSFMAFAAVGLSSDVLWPPLTATELKVLKMVYRRRGDTTILSCGPIAPLVGRRARIVAARLDTYRPSPCPPASGRTALFPSLTPGLL